MHLTTGYELTTAITNVIIFIISFYGFFKIKKKDKLWKLFFFLMSVDSFIGSIVHGLTMTTSLNIILWIILSIFFTFTVNTFLVIFLKYKVKHIIILSVLLSILMLVEIYNGLDFILTFTIYVLISMIISTIFIIKSKDKNKKYYIYAIISQFIGGIFMLTNIKVCYLNHNGVYHLFMALTMLLFLLGVNKKE